MNDDSARETSSYGRRAATYWSVDGLPEILRGLALVVLAGSASFWRAHHPTARVGLYYVILFGGMAVYFFLLERIFLDSLKSRITYPRTGYAQPPGALWLGRRTDVPLSLRPSSPYVVSYFAPSTQENATFFWPRMVRPLLGLSVLVLAGRDLLGHWLTPLAMPALAVVLYVANRGSERPIAWWSALILGLSGPLFLWLSVPASLQLTLPFLLAGAWLVAQGAYRLFDYLRTNPYPRTAEGVKA
jgi:hypothetical protein